MNIQYRTELYKLLDEYNLPKIILEDGVAEGWFTKEILKWDFDKLYLVDAWQKLNQVGDGGYAQSWHDKNYFELLERVKPFADKVTVLKGLSVEMANYVPDNSLGIAYIDACHEYDCVINDLNAYYPKVVEGGIISGHDYLNKTYGVNKAVKDFCKDRFKINIIPDTDASMTGFWFRKM